MKVSLNWLRDYVSINLPVAELAHRLTMSGNEVEAVEEIGATWQTIVVAQVVRIEPHPNADRLVLATVSLGDREQTIVTGAPNLVVGMRVPFAPVGATLIDGHTGQTMTLKPAKIRGVESAGMVCSEKELGLGDDHSGIMVLPADAPVGARLADYLGDTILTIKSTANRPDTMSMLGIAWEVAALTGQPVQPPPTAVTGQLPAVADHFAVEIADPELCSRYTAALIRNVTIGPSPQWLQDRLIAAGMRPINNVVDITNYVMLELGQPLHAFDAKRVGGNRIVVRRARPGERLVTLDGVDRQLDPSMLVIADARQPIALAGVMGGADSEVSDTTTDVLLESASFHNVTIRRTAAQLRMRSEASARFEKNISPEMVVVASQRAVRLMADLAGGTPAAGLIDVYPGRQPALRLTLRESDLLRVLGVAWPASRVADVFRALGFREIVCEADGVTATVPPWRADLRITEDLVEEVARIIGYEALPTTPLRGAVPATPKDPLLVTADRVRDVLSGAGLQEVITYPLVSAELHASTGETTAPLSLINPMTTEQALLRTTMRGSILRTVASNARFQDDGVALFEIGRIYLPRDGDLPDEQRVVAGALHGPRARRSWFGAAEPFDFFDGKGVLETLAARLRRALSVSPLSDPFYHPGRAATLLIDGAAVGTLGEVHPRLAERFDLRGPVVYFEFALAALVSTTIERYTAVTKYPEVTQDIALVVDEAIPVEAIRAVLASGKYVREARLFDVYRGAPLAAGKKSVAFALRFQAPDRTLTESEASAIRERLANQLARQVGAVVRA